MSVVVATMFETWRQAAGIDRRQELLDEIASLDAVRAKAEAAMAERMLEFTDLRRREAERQENPTIREIEAGFATDELALATKQPTRTVQCRTIRYRRVRGRLPLAWESFTAGRVDGYRVSLIADALEKLIDCAAGSTGSRPISASKPSSCTSAATAALPEVPPPSSPERPGGTMDDVTSLVPHHHADRCPGVLRPWIADDGALVRLRLVGGALTTQALADLAIIASGHADGHLYLTKRANVQLRGIEHDDGCLSGDFVAAITKAGLLPSPTHELVRNIMVSPLSGRLGGQADLRPVARRLDELLCDDPAFAGLSARFLFVLDDGRGDLVDRSLDVGVMAVDAGAAQIRVGSRHWGDVVELDAVPEVLLDLARRFLEVRSDGEATWHVDELPDAGADLLGIHHARDLRTQVASLPAPYGVLAQDDGRSLEHVAIPDGDLTHELATQVLARAGHDVIVTPWRSLLSPDLEHER